MREQAPADEAQARQVPAGQLLFDEGSPGRGFPMVLARLLGLDRLGACARRRPGRRPGLYLDGHQPLPDAETLKFLCEAGSKTAR